MCPGFALGVVVTESGVALTGAIVALIVVSSAPVDAGETASLADFAGSNENDALEAADA